MTTDKLRRAADDLNERLRGTPKFISVGIGSEEGAPVLFLYFSSLPHQSIQKRLPREWAHLPVRTRKLGKIVPAKLENL